MNRMTKTLGVVLASSLTVLAGCQPKQQNEGEAAGGGNEAAASQKPAQPGETTTYNLFFNRAETDYPQDGGEGKQIMLDGMKKAGIDNVDFNVTLTSGDEYMTKVNLMAASDQLPDYFNVDLNTMTKFAQEGLIQPLDDVLKDMPHAAKMFLPIDLKAATIDGKLYGLASAYRPEPINGPAGGFVIRQDWLDKLGLQMPNTLDELHQVLEAFVKKDPDGNGKNDTFGLGGAKPEASSPTGGFDGIFGAFGIHPTYWLESGGQLKQGMVMPEMKEALAVLQQWYKEGLIDPDFVVATGKQLNEKAVNSKVGIWSGAVWPLDPLNAIYLGLKQNVPDMSMVMLPPPEGPDGKRGWPAGGASNNFYVMSAKTKNPEQFAKMLDWTASDDPDGGHMLVTYGFEGKNYKMDNNRIILDNSGSADELTKMGLSNPVQFINVVDRRWASDPVLDGLEVTGKYTFMNEFSKTVPAQLDYPDINKLWIEYFVKIVTGSYPVDKWDEFVQKYEQQGGKQIEEQVNAEWKKSE